MEQKTTSIKKLFFDSMKIKRMIGAQPNEQLERIDISTQEVKVISFIKSKEITRLYKDAEFLNIMGIKGQILEFYWNEGRFLGLDKGLRITTKIEEVKTMPVKEAEVA